MILKLYSVRDHLVNVSHQPWAYADQNAAVRSFVAMCGQRESALSQNPSDFSLQLVGEMNTDTGVIVGYPQPEIVFNGSNYVPKG